MFKKVVELGSSFILGAFIGSASTIWGMSIGIYLDTLAQEKCKNNEEPAGEA